MSCSSYRVNAVKCFQCFGIGNSGYLSLVERLTPIDLDKCETNPETTVDCDGSCYYVEGQIKSSTLSIGSSVVVRGCDSNENWPPVKGVGKYIHSSLSSLKLNTLLKIDADVTGSYCRWDNCNVGKCDKGYFRIADVCFSFWFIPALIGLGICALLILSCCCCCCCCCKPCKRSTVRLTVGTSSQLNDQVKLI